MSNRLAHHTGAPRTTADYVALETEHGANNYKPLDVVLTHGAGAYVWDVEGRRYLDCLSAYSAVNQASREETFNPASSPWPTSPDEPWQ